MWAACQRVIFGAWICALRPEALECVFCRVAIEFITTSERSCKRTRLTPASGELILCVCGTIDTTAAPAPPAPCAHHAACINACGGRGERRAPCCLSWGAVRGCDVAFAIFTCWAFRRAVIQPAGRAGAGRPAASTLPTTHRLAKVKPNMARSLFFVAALAAVLLGRRFRGPKLRAPVRCSIRARGCADPQYLSSLRRELLAGSKIR
jgi:hypothetical protein